MVVHKFKLEDNAISYHALSGPLLEVLFNTKLLAVY